MCHGGMREVAAAPHPAHHRSGLHHDPAGAKLGLALLAALIGVVLF
jgi:hypothetical protein